MYIKEDPRIREQEWGNFQDPEKMPQVMDERRRVGAFFYRFPTGERLLKSLNCTFIMHVFQTSSMLCSIKS